MQMSQFKEYYPRKTFFRRFSRKKFAAFMSMHKVVHIAALLSVYSLIANPLKLSAQKSDNFIINETDSLEVVEIVGQINPTSLNLIPRQITFITSEESKSVASHSIIDLINYTGCIDLRQRGKDGVQADVSIRGNSFDHNLILLNGINISDPQTGHLSLFLPFETGAVDRIEILNGPAARVFGANAFSGAINFIVSPGSVNSFSLGAFGGQFGLFNNYADIELSVGSVSQGIHFENASSSGYIKNTDYRKQSFFYQGIISTDENTLEFQLGLADRSFGANGFYSPRFPDQYEENQLTFFSFGYKTGKSIKIHPQIYWRRHRDRFELFREGENWYSIIDSLTITNNTSNTQYDTISWYYGHNHHISDVYGAQFIMHTNSKFGKTSLGWHLRSENIISTNIGYDRGIVTPVRHYENSSYSKSDNRTNFDTYFEQTIDLKNAYISAGLLLNWNSYLPDEVNFFPGLDFRYYLSKYVSLYSSYNYTLGIPTFTDLSYEDPSNQGNNSLKPYTQHSIEGGIRYMKNANQFSIVGFYNSGKDVIDWVWFSDDSKFKPINIDSYTGKGVEISGIYKFSGKTVKRILSSARLNYSFIDMDKDVAGNLSKYFNIRHKASAILQHEIVKNLILSENFSFIRREGNYLLYDFSASAYTINPFEPYCLFDMRASYTINSFTFYFEGTNIFNKKYIDTGSTFQPGRWLSAGFKINVKGF
jgi:vitamin B12 transporter